MVQGFNHNIKHKGKLFHIQTEDSGRENPHIITHVFVGGNILATKKTSYADIVKAGGSIGLATAAAAWYTSFAVVTNKTFGRIVLPVKELARK